MIEPITADQMRRDYLLALYEAGALALVAQPSEPSRKLTPKEMAAQFAADHGIPKAAFFGRARTRNISHRRQECMAMIKDNTSLSLPAIGRIFNRDHTTVIHALRAVEKRASQ